jgi:GDP-4-dehydro-6-deoxy-D-mannose reductase
MSGIDVLVTGGTGYLGRHVVDLLLQKGRRVASLSRSPDTGTSAAAVRHGDLTDDTCATEVLRELEPELVVHLAGSRSHDARALLTDNVLATVRLVTAAASLGTPPRIVVASSSAVYGPASGPIDERAGLAPVTLYGVTKVAQEQAAALMAGGRLEHLVIARLFNLVGPGQSADFVLGRVAQQIAEAEQGGPNTITVRNTETERDFVDVRDAAEALVLMGDAEELHGPYNVANGVAHPIGTAIDLLMGQAACEVTLENVDEALGAGDVATQSGDPGRLLRATGWSPSHSFEESLQALLDSWRARVRKDTAT